MAQGDLMQGWAHQGARRLEVCTDGMAEGMLLPTQKAQMGLTDTQARAEWRFSDGEGLQVVAIHIVGGDGDGGTHIAHLMGPTSHPTR